jgi:hypothetical protein
MSIPNSPLLHINRWFKTISNGEATVTVNVGATGNVAYGLVPFKCVVRRFGGLVTDTITNTASIAIDKLAVATATTNVCASLCNITAANNFNVLVMQDASTGAVFNAGEFIVINVTATGTGARTVVPVVLVQQVPESLANQDTDSAALLQSA